MALTVQLDRRGDWYDSSPWSVPRPSNYRRVVKRAKARGERRRAKSDPECRPCYGRYAGHE